MTEAEWLESADPKSMLESLRGKASDRKLRLFACACCRHIWHLLNDEKSRVPVELAELYADGRTERDSVLRALKVSPMPEWPEGGPDIFNWRLVTSSIAADMTDPRTYVWLTAELSVAELTPGLVATKWTEDGARFVSAPIQASMLRDLFGNPFRPVALKSVWLAWNVGTVRRIAQGIYDDCAFDRMLILADALEDAGCDNADIFNHCRGPGPHVRGCWVVDLLLGKE
jgi:hypothetical protein